MYDKLIIVSSLFYIRIGCLLPAYRWIGYPEYEIKVGIDDEPRSKHDEGTGL